MYYRVEDRKGKYLFETADLQVATDFFESSSVANVIQKYTSKTGVTNGIIQPGIPKFIQHEGVVYKKAYLGFFTEKEADAFVNPTNKRDQESDCKFISRSFKQGYMLYAAIIRPSS